ncbi:hypothetical protein [Sphingomonas faeni]|uniref:hypothetical protein n=1 Tax=Sphingomonas faeni TaxID=185950 RepID=UPI003362673B
MRVILENDRFDAIPRLSREFVNAQTDGDMLADWYDAMVEKGAELTEFVRAREIGDFDTEALTGKLAFIKIANRWIEARLIALGHHVPYPATNPLKRELANNAKRILTLKKQVRDLGGDPDATRSDVSGPMSSPATPLPRVENVR